MHFQVGRSLHYYYIFLISFTFLILGAGAKYFWDNGPFNSENISVFYEASIQFNRLQGSKPLLKMRSLVTTDRAREAILKIGNLEKSIEFLESFAHEEQFKQLKKALFLVKGNLNELISYPQMTSVLAVLANKVASYETYVSGNGWKTLTRISRRMRSSLSARNIQSPGFFTYKKLFSLNKLLLKEMGRMEKVTRDSLLPQGDKQNILTKIKTFDTELGMLGQYAKSLKKYKGLSEDLTKKYEAWIKDIAPEITFTRIKIERETRAMALGLVGLLSFLFLGLIGGLFFNKKSVKKSKELFENNILKVIQDGLIPLENRLDFKGSSDFLREFERYREYFHKRISFGSVFQEAVPFSSILLDSNLNVSWGNDLFYQHWNLEETHRTGGNISWDYLQQYTNLGEDDPVLMAHKQGIAGIYQIQVKSPSCSEVLPYEMYVSPVEYSGQKRIMIFFYPLRSLEETMAQQAKAIVGPVSRSLELMTKGSFEELTREGLKKDFDIAGISELYEKFLTYAKVDQERRERLSGEVFALKESLADQNELIEELETFSVRKGNLAHNLKSDFESARNAVIHTIDLRFELEGLFDRPYNISSSLFKQDCDLLQGIQNSNEILQENIKAFQAVSCIKKDFKEFKNKIDELRVGLNQSLEQSLLFMKKEEIDENMEDTIGKARLEMKGIEKVFQGIEGIFRNLDVGLGKMSLIMEQAEEYNIVEIKKSVEETKKDLDNFLFEFGRIVRSGEKTDDLVVDSLKGMFDTFLLMGQFDRNCTQMIDHFRESELSEKSPSLS